MVILYWNLVCWIKMENKLIWLIFRDSVFWFIFIWKLWFLVVLYRFAVYVIIWMSWKKWVLMCWVLVLINLKNFFVLWKKSCLILCFCLMRIIRCVNNLVFGVKSFLWVKFMMVFIVLVFWLMLMVKLNMFLMILKLVIIMMLCWIGWKNMFDYFVLFCVGCVCG